MGTPSGRQRYQRMLDRTSPSPSPTKRNSRIANPTLDNGDHDNDDDGDLADETMGLEDEEDEEGGSREDALKQLIESLVSNT